MSDPTNNHKPTTDAVNRQNTALDQAHNAAEAARRQAGLPPQRFGDSFTGRGEGRPPSAPSRGKR
jgi:hypothetical protein